MENVYIHCWNHMWLGWVTTQSNARLLLNFPGAETWYNPWINGFKLNHAGWGHWLFFLARICCMDMFVPMMGNPKIYFLESGSCKKLFEMVFGALRWNGQWSCLEATKDNENAWCQIEWWGRLFSFCYWLYWLLGIRWMFFYIVLTTFVGFCYDPWNTSAKSTSSFHEDGCNCTSHIRWMSSCTEKTSIRSNHEGEYHQHACDFSHVSWVNIINELWSFRNSIAAMPLSDRIYLG